jgi:hypothetical protein
MASTVQITESNTALLCYCRLQHDTRKKYLPQGKGKAPYRIRISWKTMPQIKWPALTSADAAVLFFVASFPPPRPVLPRGVLLEG